MPYSRQDILTQNINTYPNNNSGQITPDSVKSFNQNWIQSIVFTDQTGSIVVASASYAANAGNANTANSATSASFASTAANAATATSASYALTASFALNGGGGGGTVDTGSFATTGSNQFKAAQVITGSLTIYNTSGDTNVKLEANGVTSNRLKVTSQVEASEFYGNLIGNVTGTADTASVTPNAIVTASVNVSTITFTKGNGSQFSLTIAQSGSVATASLALNSELLDGLDSTAFVSTSSYNVFTSSIQTQVNALQAATASYATKAEVNSYTGSTNAFTASIKTFTGSIQTQVNALQAATSSYATLSGNNNFVGINNFGTITASNALITNLHTVTVTSSVIYNTGSNQLGDNASDTQTLWGTVDMKTGPVRVTGSLNVSAGITGSLLGTASFANNATSASFATTASFAAFASLAQQAANPFVSSTTTNTDFQVTYALGPGYTTLYRAPGLTFNPTSSLTRATNLIATGSLFGSASTASFVANAMLTASAVANILTFTKFDGSTFNVTIAQSGSVASASFADNANTAISASYAATAQQATSASYASTAQQATSASYASNAQTAFSATSASFASTASSADVFTVRTALTASGLNYPTVDGTLSGQVLQTNAAGALSFGNVAAMYQTVINGEATSLTVGTAVYVSGSQGANPIVYRADSANASKMPVQYIIPETIASGANGRALLLGVLEGYNVGAATAGTLLYVDGNGTLTTTRPTGSSDLVQPIAIVTKTGAGGQLSVLNPGPVLLPNLQTGYTWVGNGNNQPVAVTTSSIHNVVSSSYASVAQTATSASYASTSQTSFSSTSASYATNAGTAATATSATSASYASTAQQATSASFATTASYALNAGAGGVQAGDIYSYSFLLMGA